MIVQIHIFLIEKGFTWLSTVHVTRKEIWLNGSRVKMAGIANVATSPVHLRQGHARKVMSYTPQHAMQVQGAWLAGLHCSKSGLWPFYEKCGYVHVPLQEDHVKITFHPLTLEQNYTIQQCRLTEIELHQMTTLHGQYFSHFTGPLCRSEDHCCWSTTYYNKRGVTFACFYPDTSSQEEKSKMAAYIGIRKIDNEDTDNQVKIEIVEYAGSHDPHCHDNNFFMPLLCHMIQSVCQCQPGDQVSIVYQSLMCNKAWFSGMATSEFETTLQHGFMYRYTDEQHTHKDISKLFNKFVFLLIDRF